MRVGIRAAAAGTRPGAEGPAVRPHAATAARGLNARSNPPPEQAHALRRASRAQSQPPST